MGTFLLTGGREREGTDITMREKDRGKRGLQGRSAEPLCKKNWAPLSTTCMPLSRRDLVAGGQNPHNSAKNLLYYSDSKKKQFIN